ncbi:hypothetical protein Pcinc_015802 [Petrolisthes cinctipes]|uniref:Uncharacterized protein n=1 Tax=Petrolisthes cinctipes TaxID=88211 RepID=A0AAE1FTJ4_PETCI|nr:hypothetical protein Pcinc_015802 [Petrolisthes cinctipes]
MREAIEEIDNHILASMQMKTVIGAPSQMQQTSFLRHHQKVVQRCCLALSHHTAPTSAATESFGVVLTPFLLTSPEEFGRKNSMSWSTFRYYQLGKNTNADKLFYECQAETTSNKGWKLFKNFIKSVLLSSLEFTSSLMEEHTGKIVLIKTMNEAIPNDALYWIKENCSSSSKFVITGVHGYGVRDIISDNGYLMAFKMGRIHQGQQISLTLAPRREEFIQAG